jgi:predicted nuclease of predicted toxin-antitoxin system
MKFLVDQQLPQALVQWLVVRGHEAEHVRQVGLRDADDSDIWRRALRDEAVVLTKDGDFVLLRSAAALGPMVVWLRIGNATTRALLRWLEARWSEIESGLKSGRAVIEVR